eukprot:TRINITY_DN28049_c0_g1_i1.p1 TRINITY_DN28049_c0_g1~~TRINITY_DN28049_c0_g1_i1.p1  ORF type:complete len:793 (-),score=193.86 TRINITY_DN28049_c0_g1_i1:77-2455(-)
MPAPRSRGGREDSEAAAPPPREAIAASRPLQDHQVLRLFDEFLYRGELRDLARARQSYERIASSLGAEDLDSLIPPCLEVLEFANRYIRSDTLLCLLHISMGCLPPQAAEEELGAAMRNSARVLARHDAMQMLVRALEFILSVGQQGPPLEDGMFEREVRLILNCIYLHLHFHEHDQAFVQSLQQGQGRMGASLVSLLFEAAIACADSDKIPIKKVILLLLRVLQRLLQVPDKVLYPLPTVAASQCKGPRLLDFQSFTVLHMHQRSMREKYATCGCPAAVEEGLRIAQGYEDDFFRRYQFHPSEIDFMRDSDFLRDAYRRYQEINSTAATTVGRESAKLPPSRHQVHGIPPESSRHMAAAPGLGVGGLGCLEGDRSSTPSTSSRASSCSSSPSARSSASAATEVHLPSEEPLAVDSTQDELQVPDAPKPDCQRPGKAGLTPERRLPAEEDTSPAAVFRRLYMSIYPKLSETMVLLLRLLLTSCSNVDSYTGVVDLSRERRAANLLTPDEAQSPEEAAMEGADNCPEVAEAQRHREITASAVAGVVLLLLKSARHAAAEQFASVAQLVADCNGALVVLKFLNQDLASQETLLAPAVLPCLREASVAGSPEERSTVPCSPTHWQACAMLRLVEVLYLLCKDCPERVRKYLIHYKAPFILKRLNLEESPQAQRLVLKLLRKQVRYLPRKWKQTNMKAISAIYTQVSMSPLEDWLLNKMLSETSFEGPSQADWRASSEAYNAGLLSSTTSAAASAETLRKAPEPTRERDVEEVLGYMHLFPEYIPDACKKPEIEEC